MPPEPQQKPGGSVVLRLAGDCVAAAAASVAVSPVVTAMDRAITRNAAGAQRLWPAMFEGLGQLIKQPIRNVWSCVEINQCVGMIQHECAVKLFDFHTGPEHADEVAHARL